MPRSATGIPDRDVYGDPLTGLAPGQFADWVVQQHAARRAGTHHDVRFGTPETGLYSWAVRKGLPPPGKKHLAVQQPVHAHGYKEFEGEIPSGYGAGKVKKTHEGRILITKIDQNAVHFTTAQSRYPERFTLIKPKAGNRWLLINTTPTEAIPYEKVHYATIPTDQAEEIIGGLQPGSSVQAKIDGAASLTKLYKDNVEVVSYRAAKNTGHPIVHTERVFQGRPEAHYGRDLAGTVLRGELYGTDEEGKAIPVQALGGLLNAGVGKSVDRQREQGIKLRNLIFDIQRHGQQDVTGLPYRDRLAKVKEIVPQLPNHGTFHVPEEATTPEEARALFERIRSGQHPLTSEGIVVHPPEGKPQKMKFMDEHDVHLREVFPGEGKYQGNAAGGFRYSDTPEGPILGEVGTGLSDEMRRDMFANPASYIGRVARVRAQQKFPSGALRAPALLSLHEDYPAAPVTPERQKVKAQRGQTKPIEGLGNALQALKKAKSQSDAGDYTAKHETLRQAIRAEPHNFDIDSSQAGIVGLTHKPTGFKIHMPSTAVPTEFYQAKRSTSEPDIAATV